MSHIEKEICVSIELVSRLIDKLVKEGKPASKLVGQLADVRSAFAIRDYDRAMEVIKAIN